MKARTFNSLFPRYNEAWASKILGIKLNEGKGPDLLEKDLAVEVKFKLAFKDKYYDKCWRVLGDQLDYEKEYSGFYWGLGFYWLNKEVKDVSSKDFSRLDKLVGERELYLVEGDWVRQFPIYHHKGKTHISEWDHYVLFPRMNGKFPKIISYEEVYGGKVFFTEGVDRRKFDLNYEKFDLNHPYEDSEVPF